MKKFFNLYIPIVFALIVASCSDTGVEPGDIGGNPQDYIEQSKWNLYAGDNFWNSNTYSVMFLDSETPEVFYDPEQRSFSPKTPLKLDIDDSGRLSLQFYSPVEIKDVEVYCRLPLIDDNIYRLAFFRNIPPFALASLNLPIADNNGYLFTRDDEKVWFEAVGSLKDWGIEFIIRCEDPFMKKISIIDSDWQVWFSPFGADEGHAYWRHMTPELCRHGVALVLNMAYMFASPEFNAHLERYKGKLLDNNGNPINLDDLRNTIRNHPGLTLGHVTGVGGLGGGRTYGLADYCYREVYWDWDANPLAEPHTYVRQAMFHEYGHCLGYSHESTMTYGDQWTVLCAETFVELGYYGFLPVGSKEIIDNLPR